ncbi:MAG: nuclear transport factor 2 family protein [Verrucomicrobiota bacterium]
MNSPRLLPFILAGLLPLTGFSQGLPVPSASAAAAKTTAASSLPAPPPAPDAAELTKLLKDFLAGASRNELAMHDRFWAEDLIYTASAGRRIGKADIMREVREENAAPKKDEEPAIFTAEDIRIQQYGTTAIVAFRLVGTTKKGDKTEVANYLNSGTFLKREGKWQVVNWQATKMPSENEPKK